MLCSLHRLFKKNLRNTRIKIKSNLNLHNPFCIFGSNNSLPPHLSDSIVQRNCAEAHYTGGDLIDFHSTLNLLRLKSSDYAFS